MPTASSITPIMQDYPMDHVNTVYYSQQSDIDVKLIEDTLECFRAENMLVLLQSKEFEGKTSEKEEYYGIEYSVDKIDEGLMEQLEKRGDENVKGQGQLLLDLPEKNYLIAGEIEKVVKREEDEYDREPVMINKSEKSVLYYQRDNKYLVPKGYVYMKVYTNENGTGVSGTGELFMELWKELVELKTVALTYQADMASLYL